MLELDDKRVLVLGLGVSGRSAAAFCAEHGARVVAAEEGPLADTVPDLPSSVEVSAGAPFPDPADFDLVVPSPGVPRERYAARARRVWGDVEIAYRALAIPLIAVTGTNGKSTTVLLIEAMLRSAGLRVRAAGNLGAPALGLVGEALDVAVIEVSSFQLDTTEAFRPRVSVVLNITPDHLDRHGSFGAYAAAKARIKARQEAPDVAVLNFDDAVVRGFGSDTRASVLPFQAAGPLASGAWIDTGAFVLNAPELLGRTEPLRLSLDGSKLRGAHNLENITAALCAVAAFGVDPKRAVTALAHFEGLPHRNEVVGRVRGVTFVDDSKATNPGASIRSVSGAGGPVVWIAGGRGKGLDFGALANAACRHARAAVLIGESAGALEEAIAGRMKVQHAASLEEAVDCAARCARPGDTVLLSPACASQDQFRDFAERGDRFRAAVERLSADSGDAARGAD